MNGFKVFDFYKPAPPPPPPLRVYTHLKAGERLEVFEAEGPIADAIRQVRGAGYPRAMVLL